MCSRTELKKRTQFVHGRRTQNAPGRVIEQFGEMILLLPRSLGCTRGAGRDGTTVAVAAVDSEAWAAARKAAATEEPRHDRPCPKGPILLIWTFKM